MFKNTERIGKAIDMLVKVTADIENNERKQQAVSVIHDLSKLQQDCFGDLRDVSE